MVDATHKMARVRCTHDCRPEWAKVAGRIISVLSLFWLSLPAAVSAASSKHLSVCQHDEVRYAYRLELANLILEKTASTYGRSEIFPAQGGDPTQQRCLALLGSGHVDLVFVPPTEDRLRDFDYVPIDLHNGMLGYRVFIIHQDDRDLFARVQSLADLQNMVGGFGSQWGDFKVFALNGLPVVGAANSENLLAMLQQKRFNYFHRGLHEAWAEVEAYQERYPDLIVEERVALVYPLPVYFMFNKANTKLKQRFEEGFRIIKADGSFKSLFNRHFGHLVEKANLHRRVLIPISYPNPEGLPPIDTSLWLP